MIKIFISLCIALVLIGCTTANQSNVTYEEYKPQKNIKQERKQVQSKQKVTITKKEMPTTGSIKGNVIGLTFSKGLWNYEVKSTDTSNQKLSFAKFTHEKKLARKGDFVYVIIKNAKLKEIYLIKKSNFVQAKIKKQHKKQKKIIKKSYRKTRKYQVIGVPTVESITLD